MECFHPNHTDFLHRQKLFMERPRTDTARRRVSLWLHEGSPTWRIRFREAGRLTAGAWLRRGMNCKYSSEMSQLAASGSATPRGGDHPGVLPGPRARGPGLLHSAWPPIFSPFYRIFRDGDACWSRPRQARVYLSR